MDTNHIVRLFDDELKYLADKIIYMGEFAADMVERSVNAIINKDAEAAKQVMQDDFNLNQCERDIDEKAIAIIAKRQPMAVDLRSIIGSIRIASDIERIGDKGKNIARRGLTIIEQDFDLGQFHTTLCNFATITIGQLRAAVDAYKTKSRDMIKDVINCEIKTDSVYETMFRSLLTYMIENPRNITACTELLFCVKNLERVGDHSTNIVESIHYIITGEYMCVEDYKK